MQLGAIWFDGTVLLIYFLDGHHTHSWIFFKLLALEYLFFLEMGHPQLEYLINEYWHLIYHARVIWNLFCSYCTSGVMRV
jgi:hypothetical protein